MHKDFKRCRFAMEVEQTDFTVILGISRIIQVRSIRICTRLIMITLTLQGSYTISHEIFCSEFLETNFNISQCPCKQDSNPFMSISFYARSFLPILPFQVSVAPTPQISQWCYECIKFKVQILVQGNSRIICETYTHSFIPSSTKKCRQIGRDIS